MGSQHGFNLRKSEFSSVTLDKLKTKRKQLQKCYPKKYLEFL